MSIMETIIKSVKPSRTRQGQNSDGTVRSFLTVVSICTRIIIAVNKSASPVPIGQRSLHKISIAIALRIVEVEWEGMSFIPGLQYKNKKIVGGSVL